MIHGITGSGSALPGQRPTQPAVNPDEFSRRLEEAQRGDQEAIAVLWRAWNPRIVRYARARGTLDADDIASQVWLDAARALARFQGGPDQFTSWLFTVARRRIVDEHRRRGRRPEVTMADVPESPGGRDRLSERDDLEAAITLIRRLPDDQADAVLLRVVADLDVSEVAEIMGHSEGNVRVLTHRGLKRLAELLGVGFEPSDGRVPGGPDRDPEDGDTEDAVTGASAPAISPER